MRSAYRSVLRRGDVLSALVPYVFARLPLTMAPLALLLLTQQQTGSYHRAGLVCGAYAVAVAVAAPVLGRLVDRHGQSRVLLPAGVTHAAAMVGAAVAASAGLYWLLLLTALVAGASLPPVTACIRVLWTRLLSDESAQQAGFAIDGVIVEVAELSGPLLVSLLLVVGRPATAVATAGVLMGLAAVAFRSTRASREVPAAGIHRGPWGALAVRGVRRLLVVVACSTATIGAVEVAITAYARHHGGMSTSGVYIGVISVGGIVAGITFGGAGRVGRRRPVGVLAVMLLLSAAAAAALAQWSAPAAVVAVLFLFGSAVAIGVIIQLATMASVVNDDIRTEAFTWGATANFVGLGVGTAVSGWMVEQHGLHAAFLVATVPTVLAALLTLVSRTALTTMPAVQPEAVEVVDAREADDVADPVDVDEPADVDDAVIALAPGLDAAALADEVTELQLHVHDLELALAAALDTSTHAVDDARERAQRMLDRADAACLELRNRAADDAERVRSAATTAALEILAAAERDARAMLERARRDAEAVMARMRGIPAQEAPARPTLHALPGVEEPTPADEAAASS
jgi:MFS family permease/vacuolar-type H+-ATPase subunit H